MKIRKWIWILTLILVLSSLPALYERWTTETENDTYELIIPFKGIYDVVNDDSITVDEALITLQEAGMTTVALEPDSLSQWEKDGVISIYTKNYLEEILKFNNKVAPPLAEEDGFYITIPEESYYLEKIHDYFHPEEIVIGSQPLYFISNGEAKLDRSLGYNLKLIEKLKNMGLNYTLRIYNQENISTDMIEEINNLYGEHSTNLLYSGTEALGYPDVPKMKNLAIQFHEVGYNFYSIEFANLKGNQTIARETNYDFIRLHSLDLGIGTVETNVDRAIRAVKERNIRSVFIHIPIGDPMSSIEVTTEFLQSVSQQMPDNFQLGNPIPFDPIERSVVSFILLLLAGILFTYLAFEKAKLNRLKFAAVVFMFFLAGLYILVDRLLLLQGFGLIIAIITPVFAVLSASEGTTRISQITWQYLKAIGISFIGIIIVIGLLNDLSFITGFELFRGVKLVFVMPIALITLYVIAEQLRLKGFIALLNTGVKYWHLLALAVIGAALLYYVSRTGNAGSVANIELLIRQKLEEILYVRPRTKEFLIGFPFFILALYVMGIYKNWGKYLLIPGTIGFLSIMNTFTHFHIPIFISLLRTVYSLVLGYLIGLLLIYLFNIIRRNLPKVKKWSDL